MKNSFFAKSVVLCAAMTSLVAFGMDLISLGKEKEESFERLPVCAVQWNNNLKRFSLFPEKQVYPCDMESDFKMMAIEKALENSVAMQQLAGMLEDKMHSRGKDYIFLNELNQIAYMGCGIKDIDKVFKKEDRKKITVALKIMPAQLYTNEAIKNWDRMTSWRKFLCLASPLAILLLGWLSYNQLR